MEMLDTVKKRRSTEIYSQWKETRQKLEKQAEENSKEVEASWKLQGTRMEVFNNILFEWSVRRGSLKQIRITMKKSFKYFI